MRGRQSGQGALFTSPPKSDSPSGRGTRALPPQERGGRRGIGSSVTQTANTFPVYKTCPPRRTPARGRPRETATFQGGFKRPRATGRGALPAESAPIDGRLPAPAAQSYKAGKPPRAKAPPVSAELHGSTLWSHPFASERFHVLLNSLFKVLFNFPSRYLFAIGLVSVFSLRWSLPPTLGCIPKQPDSGGNTRGGSLHPRGLTPALGKVPIRRTQTLAGHPRCCP